MSFIVFRSLGYNNGCTTILLQVIKTSDMARVENRESSEFICVYVFKYMVPNMKNVFRIVVSSIVILSFYGLYLYGHGCLLLSQLYKLL